MSGSSKAVSRRRPLQAHRSGRFVPLSLSDCTDPFGPAAMRAEALQSNNTHGLLILSLTQLNGGWKSTHLRYCLRERSYRPRCEIANGSTSTLKIAHSPISKLRAATKLWCSFNPESFVIDSRITSESLSFE